MFRLLTICVQGKTLPLGLYGAMVVSTSDEQNMIREFVLFLGSLGMESAIGHQEEEEESGEDDAFL